MKRAYSVLYLDDAMNNLGEMMDYVSTDCGMNMDEYFKLFIRTGYADLFGKGVPDYVSGKSGVELAWDVFNDSGCVRHFAEPQNRYYRTVAYWCGWILAYYQWYSGMPFKEIMNYINFEKLSGMYAAFHEMAEQQFADAMDEMIHQSKRPVKLQILRKNQHLSQRQLAEKSGVSLRAIQQYEQRKKDINKAQAAYLAALAKSLGCKIDDLLEYETLEL